MKQYTVTNSFFCTALKKYIPAGAVLYRSDISSRLVITGLNDSSNRNNYELSSFELVTGNDIAWFDSLVAQGYSAFMTLNGSLGETVSGAGVQGFVGHQGFIGNQGFVGNQGFKGSQGFTGFQGIQGPGA